MQRLALKASKVEDKSVPVIDCNKSSQLPPRLQNNACRIASEYYRTKSEGQLRNKDICRYRRSAVHLWSWRHTTITWKFVDGAGNEKRPMHSNQNVEDKSVPVIDCFLIQPITAEITDNSCRIALTLTAPKAKDNCDKGHHGTAVLPSTFGLGDTTITWKFTDAGNEKQPMYSK